MAGKPWWRQWYGLPPSMQQRRDYPESPLTRSELLTMRFGWPLLILVALLVAVFTGYWSGVAMVIIPIATWARYTPAQRKQVLGRP